MQKYNYKHQSVNVSLTRDCFFYNENMAFNHQNDHQLINPANHQDTDSFVYH